MPRLGREFFSRSALELGPRLPGLVMSRRLGGVLRRARLVEVEAYLGPKDLASHSSKGRTARTEVMFGPPGRAYVYFIYGMHWMFNIVAGVEGEAHALLVRAAEPLDGWDADLTGPAKLAKAFRIGRAENRMDLVRGEIAFHTDARWISRVVRSKRINVDYARHWKERLLRFVDVRNPVAARLATPGGPRA
jgi:DNA-3-methyladenine glycosylase